MHLQRRSRHRLPAAGCGGGGSAPSSSPPPAPSSIPLTAASAASAFAAGCNGTRQSGTLYRNGPVEPQVAVNPANPKNFIGVWQQDRWSDGGAQALMTGVSQDAGRTWTRQALPFARCAGGNAANGGDYERASDPWVSFSPNGAAYQIGIAFSGGVLAAGSSGAVLVSRSADGGVSWGAPSVLIQDGAAFFNDKESVTADSTDSNFAYAVWDRLSAAGGGPTYFARTANGGQSWEAARPVYDPGVDSQTIGNQIVVLPDGSLALFFTRIDTVAGGMTAHFAVMRSADHGGSWSAPVTIAAALGVGATDPKTGAAIRDGTGLLAVAVGPAGQLAAAWQDARFSNGRYDGIAVSQSADGGASWSAPVEVNGDPSVQAFTPSVRFGADGSIGVSYFDFRDDASNPSALLTDYWLSLSRNGGGNWADSRIAGPFSLLAAPESDGQFLGDYQALAALPTGYLLFFVQADGSHGYYSDVEAGEFDYAAAARAPVKAAVAAAQFVAAPAFTARVSDAIRRNLRDQTPPRMRRAGRRERE